MSGGDRGMTGIILYRLKKSGDPFAIPVSGVAYLEVGWDQEYCKWCLDITTVDGSSFTIGVGTKEYCESKLSAVVKAMSENQNIIDVTEW
jgi:hypothetical protein